MLIKTTRLDDGWRKSLRADDAAAFVAVYEVYVNDARLTIAQVAEPKQLQPTIERYTFLQGGGPRTAGTPHVYFAVVAGGFVAIRRWRHMSLEDAAAACVACAGNLREPVTYVAIAGELVRVVVRIERGYDRENRKVLESPVYTPQVLPTAGVGLVKTFQNYNGGRVRLTAFAVDDAAFAIRAHCPAYIAAVVARVYSLVDWEYARAYLLSGALVLEANEYHMERVRDAIASVRAARIELQSSPLRRVATMSVATLETYEESAYSGDEWLDILAQNLAKQQLRGGDGIVSSSWGWPDPSAPRSPN